jgi:hypothetical protein
MLINENPSTGKSIMAKPVKYLTKMFKLTIKLCLDNNAIL